MKRVVILLSVLLACGSSASLHGQSVAAVTGFPGVLSWPARDNPTLKFSLGRLQAAGLYNGQSIFTCEVEVQNLSDQPLPKSVFTIFVYDKDNVRIGRGLLRFPELHAKGTEKAQLQFSTAGTPSAASVLVGRTVPLKISSTPPGAALKVDGHEAGTTPRVVDFTIGMHTVELAKEGYAIATSPLEVTGDEVEGGGISFELGGQSKDTVLLRDGSSILGDVLSMSMTSVTVRVEGKEQKIDRNLVSKIILVERISEQTTGHQPSNTK